MHDVKELSRHAAPAGRPQPLALLGDTLWVGSWETDRLYAIDLQTWSLVNDVIAPGRPYGLARAGDGLRVVVSLGEDDDRYLYRFSPTGGFDAASKTPCPELTGSHLASHGGRLFLCQSTFQRILEIDDAGHTLRAIALPTRCAGMGFGPGGFSIISADAEFEHLQLSTLDLELNEPEIGPTAEITFDARSLVFDGNAWWTSHREAGQIVSFIT